MIMKETGSLSGGRKKRTNILFIFIIILAVICIAGFLKFYERERPQITLLDDISLIGSSKKVNFSIIDNRSGIRELFIQLKQNDKKSTIYTKTFPRLNIFSSTGPEKIEESINVEVKTLGFEDGPAELLIITRDFSWWNWLSGNESTLKTDVTIDTIPPLVSVTYSPQYIRPGGSGIITYRVNEPVEKHGVSINDYFHPGFPVAEPNDGRYIAFIGIPHSIDKLEGPKVVVMDQANNQGMAGLGMILKKVRVNKDRIFLNENFLNQKLPEFAQNYPEMTGSAIEQYLFINNKVREENNNTISEACRTSSPKRLWKGRFKRMARSSRRASFADQRTYYFQGKQVDKQMHLGIDLASTKHSQVKAANHGLVVFTGYLGIYGNTIILDHGQGVFSLYAHLSRINVALEDAVEQNALIGLSGTTGMAGGDHLHFSMLINGIFVNPIEWWDSHWLKVNITDFL